MKVTVIGAGLAGVEAAWALAQRGAQVDLYEMKPVQYSPAHKYTGYAELICSNSLKAKRVGSAAGLMKEDGMQSIRRLLCVSGSRHGLILLSRMSRW